MRTQVTITTGKSAASPIQRAVMMTGIIAYLHMQEIEDRDVAFNGLVLRIDGSILNDEIHDDLYKLVEIFGFKIEPPFGEVDRGQLGPREEYVELDAIGYIKRKGLWYKFGPAKTGCIKDAVLIQRLEGELANGQ